MTNEYNNQQELGYPGVYPNDNEIIPYSPRRQFDFMQPRDTTDNQQELGYPGVYPNDNEIIPYSPRRQFDFMQQNETTNDRTMKLESMRDMSIDQIVDLYKNGYRIETSPIPTIETASDGITISNGIIILLGVGTLVYILLKRY